MLPVLLAALALNAMPFGPMVCEESDLTCLHQSLLEHSIEVESLRKQLEISKLQTTNAEMGRDLWKQQAEFAQGAIKEATAALKPPSILASPVLWGLIGVAVGAAAAVAIVYAVSPAFR